jgi:threonyl-tRNA synthetase
MCLIYVCVCVRANFQACAVTNVSRAFWRADVKREGLQRVYGITFPDNKQLKEYQHRIEEVSLLFMCGVVLTSCVVFVF